MPSTPNWVGGSKRPWLGNGIQWPMWYAKLSSNSERTNIRKASMSHVTAGSVTCTNEWDISASVCNLIHGDANTEVRVLGCD